MSSTKPNYKRLGSLKTCFLYGFDMRSNTGSGLLISIISDHVSLFFPKVNMDNEL